MTHKDKILTAHKSGQIIRIYEHRTDGYIDGFVSAVGEEYFMLEQISDTIHFDGFYCLAFTDVTNCDAPAPYHEFKQKALKARKLTHSVAPDLDLSSLPLLLDTARKAFPILTLHMKFDDDEDDYEEDLSDVCYIGKVTQITETHVMLQGITPDASWEAEIVSYELDLIYGTSFGGAYEEALLLVANSNN